MCASFNHWWPKQMMTKQQIMKRIEDNEDHMPLTRMNALQADKLQTLRKKVTQKFEKKLTYITQSYQPNHNILKGAGAKLFNSQARKQLRGIYDYLDASFEKHKN